MQFRGFKYGVSAGLFTFFLMPVVRQQTFVRRITISAIPFVYFMKAGHTWGHEIYWRKAKEVVVTYEMLSGTRSNYTMK